MVSPVFESISPTVRDVVLTFGDRKLINAEVILLDLIDEQLLLTTH